MNKVSRPLTTAASLVFLLPAALLATGSAADGSKATAAPRDTAAPACSSAGVIERTLRGGGTWRMCWHTTPYEGLVLEDISFQPKHETKPIKILRRAGLAQIHVAYDDGSREYSDVTEYSLGTHPEPLRPQDCPGGLLKKIDGKDDNERTTKVNGLCITTQERGFAFHGDSGDVSEPAPRTDTEQGQDLVLYSVNSAGYYHYINQWNFSDDGTITPKAGATGNLSPGDFDAADGKGWPIGKGSKDYATSHQHNVFWRLDFAPDGTASPRIEQYDTRQTGSNPDRGTPLYTTTHKTVTKELGGTAGGDTKRWWRVVSSGGKNADGHPRSWEIVHQNHHKYTGRPFTEHDIYFTQYKENEQYASDNARIYAGRPDSVQKFLNGERLTYPVVWVNVGFHHIVRDEDQTPMPVHWQGFQIAPRDVTAMNPLTPERLSKYNGRSHDHH